MFTAGLELRTRAAEPSGPASLSLEGCWGERAALLGFSCLPRRRFPCRGGGGRGELFLLQPLVLSVQKGVLLTHSLPPQPAKKQYKRLNPGRSGATQGRAAWAAAPSPPIPLDPAFLKLLSSEPEGGREDSPSSPCLSQIQTTNRGPRRAPSSKLPGFFLLGAEGLEREEKF